MNPTFALVYLFFEDPNFGIGFLSKFFTDPEIEQHLNTHSDLKKFCLPLPTKLILQKSNTCNYVPMPLRDLISPGPIDTGGLQIHFRRQIYRNHYFVHQPNYGYRNEIKGPARCRQLSERSRLTHQHGSTTFRNCWVWVQGSIQSHEIAPTTNGWVSLPETMRRKFRFLIQTRIFDVLIVFKATKTWRFFIHQYTHNRLSNVGKQLTLSNF